MARGQRSARGNRLTNRAVVKNGTGRTVTAQRWITPFWHLSSQARQRISSGG